MSALVPNIHRLDIILPGETTTVLLTIIDPTTADVIGTVQLSCKGKRVASFSRLFVADRHRQRGLGRALVGAADRIARASGSEAIACECHPSNLQAQAFYRRLGFTVAFQFDDGSLIMHRQTIKEAAPV